MQRLTSSSVTGAVCGGSGSSCQLQRKPNCKTTDISSQSEELLAFKKRHQINYIQYEEREDEGNEEGSESIRQAKEELCTEKFTIIIFPFLALFLGCLATPVARKLNLSYTLVLLFIGMSLGVIGCALDLGLLSTSLRQWVHLNPPTAFFYIFLAPLIFEASFNTRWHVFKRLIIPILTAAFVIVILQVGLIAVFQKMVIRTGQWTWWAAFMFGSMLSATDPISVTATLKSLGASEFLNTLIEGESLLNDGSAFVLWEAFFENTVHDGALSIPEIIVSIFRLSLGGAAMGIAFGIVALTILGLVYDEFEVETSLTVIVAFLGFWTAQAPSKLSGVICNVASGLIISAFGRHLITPSVREPLAEFWELLGWIANTIVFVHAGVLLTVFTWSCSGEPNKWYDYLYIFAYYFYLQIIRMALIFLFSPIMRIRNKWFRWREALVVGFSGLRGAVSLVLALDVAGSESIPTEVRSRVVLWTTGIVGLSLLVNGILVKPLISKLNLDKANKSREDFLQRARALVVQKTLMILDSLSIENSFRATRWSFVVKSVLPHEWLEETTHAEGYRDIMKQVLDNSLVGMRASIDSVRRDAHDRIAQSRVSERMSREFDAVSVQRTPKLNLYSGLPISKYDYASDIARYSTRLSRSRAASTERRFSTDVAPTVSPSGRKVADIEANVTDSDTGTATQLGSALLNSPTTPSTLPTFQSACSIVDGYHIHRFINADTQRDGQINDSKSTQAGFHNEDEELNRHLYSLDYETNEKDREVRRRLLTAILSQVRAVVNTSLIEFSVVHNLEEDIQRALDANEELKEYDLFSFLDNQSKLLRGPLFQLFVKALEGPSLRGEMAITTAFIISGIMTEILKEETLHESPIVQRQAEKLYQSSAALLNRFESLNPEAFEWVQSQFAVYVCESRQDTMLKDLLESGIVDNEEYANIHEELIEVRREYTSHRHSLLKINRKRLPRLPAPRQLIVKHPLLQTLSRNSMQIIDRYGELVHLTSGQELKSTRGALIIVLDGLLRPLTNPSYNQDTLNTYSFNADQFPSLEGSSGIKWYFPKYNAFCGPVVTILPRTDQDRQRIFDMKFGCSETVDKTTIFTLPITQVEELSKANIDFRMELTRSLARQIVLESLAGQQPYYLSKSMEAVTLDVDVHTTVGRAIRVLERLPYMKVITLDGEEGSSLHLQGPGVLLKGTVRISIVDLGDSEGSTNLLHDELTGPALLPAGDLLIEEVRDGLNPEATAHESSPSKYTRDTSETLTSESVRKTKSEKSDEILAHILIEEILETDVGVDKTAIQRLQRWTAKAELVDMNGRFGICHQVQSTALTNIHVQNPQG